MEKERGKNERRLNRRRELAYRSEKGGEEAD